MSVFSKKSIIAIAVVSSISLMLPAALTGCASLGETPSDKQTIHYKDSVAWDSERGSFVNLNQDEIDEMQDNMSLIEMLTTWWASDGQLEPPGPLPEQIPDLSVFSAENQDIRSMWLGHSSFLINFKGTNILIDPVFGQASPVSFAGTRFQPPVIKREQLPSVDYVVISHDHYDHLEMETAKFFADKDITYLVPLGVSSHLVSWGVPRERIIEMDWWQETTLDGITFANTPSQHFSGRTTSTSFKTLWSSWVIKDDVNSLFFSGDTGYGPHFKAIGKKYGPFDLAFMENGQYNERWPLVHLIPEQGIKAFNELNAKTYYPIHWGMFNLALHDWDEPIKTIDSLTKENDIKMIAPQIGEVAPLLEYQQQSQWWLLP
ncbi:MBL fold metallo-hydrolase [Thalassotalea agarivorans]|uniref:L-ascorbate metabolism protein UlaG, beta-lactamase superfamily n=1 Tax=Thalassotalea agarivorans TaxID=349064 RepID=A0A1I0CZ08_THASX|nr:MBL fold metallo-hydrolase [Thalassotalea agarivorans]SET24370.1 L-ascorbate metabolism protein UlaG, beta-lactamase superfamily [Thalassotalea agarivorans]